MPVDGLLWIRNVPEIKAVEKRKVLDKLEHLVDARQNPLVLNYLRQFMRNEAVRVRQPNKTNLGLDEILQDFPVLLEGEIQEKAL